jgi:hypothetical protein
LEAVGNEELAEAIAVFIRESGEQQLRNLEWLLAQQDLERPDLQDEVRKRPVSGSSILQDDADFDWRWYAARSHLLSLPRDARLMWLGAGAVGASDVSRSDSFQTF